MTTRIGWERWVVAGASAATIAAIVAPVAGRTHAWIGGALALAIFGVMPWVARALPSSLEGVWRRRRVASLLWVLVAALGVLQVGRLSAFMADASREWGATVPEPLSTHHQCMAAYVYGADLSRRGVDNLYQTSWYPVFDPPTPSCRRVSSSVQGLAAWESDAYAYPPPFLLLPRAALALTSSYATIRAWWFVIQTLVLVAAGVLAAVWIGGAAGLTVGLLLPALLASLETMFNLQFGQFHAVAMILACAAMVAVQARRSAWGGALLAAAILSKLFPGILLVVLAVRREWRALAWTAAFGAAYSLIGLVVLGPRPYAAFFEYQLPRIASGEAFHFTNLVNRSVFLISRNLSIAGLGAKLSLLGAPPAARMAAAILPWVFTLALLAFAVWAARGERCRLTSLLLWIALLDLAALRSPEAPSAYVLAPVPWLLMLLATRVRGRWPFAVALGVVWALVIGPPPLPDRIELPVGMFFQAIAYGVCIVTAVAAASRREVLETAPMWNRQVVPQRVG